MEHNVLQQLVFSVMHNIFGVLDVYAVRPWYSNDLVKSSRKISLSPKPHAIEYILFLTIQ